MAQKPIFPFADVSPGQRRPPSWIQKHATPKLDVNSLRPAPLPDEFVSAVQTELRSNAPSIDRGVARRRSSMPPARPQTRPPPRPNMSAETAARSPSVLPSTSESQSSPFAAQVMQQQLDQATHEATQAAKEGLEHALMDLANARSVIYETAALQLAELATTIARRVIARELSVDPNVVHSLVEEGMRALERQDRLFIRIGSAFADVRESLLARLDAQAEQVDVQVDPTLSDYGCVVETEHGWVDESIETRLATLLQGLRADSDSP